MPNSFIRDVREILRRLRNRGIELDGNRQYPAIPTIDDSVESHTNALRAIREALETHERRNPRAALDSFVRLYELEDVLGGFQPGESSITNITNVTSDGSLYIGNNLGTGAGVYKATDDTTDPHQHTFRTIRAGQHISISQGETEITITGLCDCETGDGGDGSGRAIPSLVDSFPQRCGASSTTYTPATDTAAAQVGDLVLWFIYFQEISTSTLGSTAARIEIPAGWKFYLYDTYKRNSSIEYFTLPHRLPTIAYKFLTEADLSASHTAVTRLAGSITQVCSYGAVVRGAHPDRPLSPVSHQSEGLGSGLIYPAWAPRTPVFGRTLQFTTGVSPRGATGETTGWHTNLAIEPDAWSLELIGAIAGNGVNRQAVATRTYARFIDPDVDENWIPGETQTQRCLATNGWTHNLIGFTPASQGSAVVATGGTGRHYLEWTAQLTAGEKYSFLAQIAERGSSTGFVVAYIDPADTERGVIFIASDTSTYAYTVYDPAADAESVWFPRSIRIQEDGVPSDSGVWAALYFVAQTSGTYKFRIYCTDRNGGGYRPSGDIVTDTTFNGTGSTAQRFYVYHTRFSSGYKVPAQVWTPDGAIFPGDPLSTRMGLHDPIWWLNKDNQYNEGNTTVVSPIGSFTITPAWNAVPYGRIREMAVLTANNSYISDDGLTTDTNLDPCGDDLRSTVMADFLIYPTDRDDVPTRAYFEVTALNNPTNGCYVSVTPSCQMRADAETGGHGPYSINVNHAANTVFGCAVDFLNGVVDWYVNGVLDHTDTMVTNTYPSTGVVLREQPLFIQAAHDGAYNTTMTRLQWNFTGPFVHGPPTGFLPADAIGSVDVSSEPAPIYNIGVGVPLAVTGPNNEIFVKSLLAEELVTITPQEREVTIRGAIDHLPVLSPGAQDLAADYALVFDASANAHKRMLLGAMVPIPAGGSAKQVLTKNTISNFDVAWAYPIPTGGDVGQVLTKLTSADFAAVWADAPGDMYGGGGGTVFDPMLEYNYFEDFAPTELSGSSYASDWYVQNSGAGSYASFFTTPTAVGAARCHTGTTTTGYGRTIFAGLPTDGRSVIATDSVPTYITMRVCVEYGLPDVTNNYNAQFGLVRNLGSGANRYGIYAGIARDAADGIAKFFLVTRTWANVETWHPVPSPLPANATWYVLTIEVTDTYSTLTIDGVLALTVSSPTYAVTQPAGSTAGMGPFVAAYKNAGTSARSAWCDYFWIRKLWTSGRPTALSY